MTWPRFFRNKKTGLSRCMNTEEEEQSFFRNRDPREWELIQN